VGESKKMGFTRALYGKQPEKGYGYGRIEVIGVRAVSEAVEDLF
jgi:hypothetical protein